LSERQGMVTSSSAMVFGPFVGMMAGRIDRGVADRNAP
jgi:hypothetical protein